ncbi:MAG: transcriptional repressor LexA [Gammaproteobacteria bacterium]|nr:transcriptional repressor LexA [Gammaproteobacteria bacterium]
MSKLTDRQNQVLELIRGYIDNTGYPPTRADIARELGFRSPNAAEEHLRALERKGMIEMTAGASRGIRLSGESGIPVVGRVAAGSPLLATEHIEQHVQVPPALFSPRADYFLRVSGMSMKDAGIIDGDLLAVHRTTEARQDQIVVARIDDEVTVKRLHRTRERHIVELLPENADFAPLRIDMREHDFTLEGISVGVLRLDT